MRRIIALLLATALLMAACGGDDDTAADDVATSVTPTQEPATPTAANTTAAADGGTLLEMLAAVPDTEDAASYLTYTDLAMARDLTGVDAPDADASAEEVDEWWTEFAGATTDLDAEILGLSDWVTNFAEDAELIRTELGFDVADIDQVIEAGAPPATFQILRGRFDAEEIADAVESDPNWSADLERKTEGDVEYYSWLGDYEQSFDHIPTAHDKLGRGGRLAVVDGMLLWSLGTDEMVGMLQALDGSADSLADREDFGEMAAVIDETGVLSAAMSDVPQSAADFDDIPAAEPRLAPYTAYSVASGEDADGAFMALVVASKNDETANENITRLTDRIENGTSTRARGPWVDIIEDFEIDSDGRLTIAKLRGDDLPYEFALQGDPLLLME